MGNISPAFVKFFQLAAFSTFFSPACHVCHIQPNHRSVMSLKCCSTEKVTDLLSHAQLYKLFSKQSGQKLRS